jgi:hypothetical protein
MRFSLVQASHGKLRKRHIRTQRRVVGMAGFLGSANYATSAIPCSFFPLACGCTGRV